MDHLGGVLDALYTTPACASFHGRVRRWSDPWAVQQRLAGRSAGSTGISGAASGGVAAGSTGVTGDEAHGGGPEFEVASGFEELAEVWWDELGRTRVDRDQLITVSDQTGTTSYSPGAGVHRIDARQQVLVEFPTWLWSSRSLIPSLEITDVTVAVDGTGNGDGSGVWRVTAHAVPSFQIGLPTELALVGERFEFDVDRATGIIVRMVGMLTDGRVVSRVTWDLFDPNAAVPSSVIDGAFPADATNRTLVDHVIDRARARGLDVSGVDPDWSANEVHAFIEERHRDRTQHVPTGQPPADADAARADIVSAAVNLTEVDGEDLVHVQAGAGLGPVGAAAQQRHPDTVIEVDSVQFLDERDAVVRLTIRSGGRPLLPGYEMRAVRDGDRWKVTRHSFASLMGLAGVPCPPPGL